MASLLPHPLYAEHQPHARTILTTHVTHRSFQTGALLGLTSSLVRHLFSRPSSAFRSTGTGASVGLALGIPLTFARMRGRSEIEWRDRAWRLLENRGQVEVEGWSLLGSVGGAVAVAAREGRWASGKGKWVRARMLAGGAGMGNLVGVLGYLGWRYGVEGGE